MGERRSVRDFDKKKISKKLLKKILFSGVNSPVTLNSCNYEILVLDNEKEKKIISNLHEYSKFAINANKIIVLYWNDDEVEFLDERDEINKTFKTNNLQNICLGMQIKAHNLGIGSCQIGLDEFDKIKLKTDLDFFNKTPEIVLALGYYKKEACHLPKITKSFYFDYSTMEKKKIL